ncbi:MAG TPA: SLC13 family permease [Polyangiaceae bacterium]|nr:SLC13 family permease [Polyangiaceae bacterium]
MTASIWFVTAVVGATAYLFATERFRLDVTAFTSLTALLLGGILTVPEALAGFAEPTVHMIAALFVVGGAVFHTGLADMVGRWLERRAAGSQTKVTLSVMLTAATLSAFLSSTGTVAVMIPIAVALGRRAGLAPARMLMPLAFTTLLGGLLTLIATAPNLVVSGALESAGFAPFAFFDFTKIGLPLLAIGLLYLTFWGPRFLPAGDPSDTSREPPSTAALWHRYGLDDWIAELEILEGSPLAGRTLAESQVRTRRAVVVLAIRASASSEPEATRADRTLAVGERLTVKGSPERIAEFCSTEGLHDWARPQTLPGGLVTAEMLLPPDSSFVGKTVADTRLRSRFDVTVLSVFRTRHVLRESVAQTELAVGDLLLLVGSPRSLAKLRDDSSDGILLTTDEAIARVDFRTQRAPLTAAILLGMLIVMAAGWLPPVVATIGAALLLVLLDCIDPATASRSISWESVLLIAAILPLATALTKTGALRLVVEALVGVLQGSSPYLIQTGLFLLTALIGIVISNTATAVLVAPVATQLASRLELRPEPLLMTVAVAASSAFLAPVSSPVNMLVMNAGGYKFGDFARLGVPLLLLTLAGTLLFVPLFFPF